MNANQTFPEQKGGNVCGGWDSNEMEIFFFRELKKKYTFVKRTSEMRTK